MQIAVCLHPPLIRVVHGAHKHTTVDGREQTAAGTQNSLAAVFWQAASGQRLLAVGKVLRRRRRVRHLCDCAARTLGEMESRPRPHVALRRCKTSAICLLLLLLRQRVRQGARMKEAFIKAQPICCYPALIEHKSQQLACWDNKSLSGLETRFKPHVKSASLERAVNHTELSMQINFSKVFTSQGTFKKIPSIVS